MSGILLRRLEIGGFTQCKAGLASSNFSIACALPHCHGMDPGQRRLHVVRLASGM